MPSTMTLGSVACRGKLRGAQQTAKRSITSDRGRSEDHMPRHTLGVVLPSNKPLRPVLLLVETVVAYRKHAPTGAVARNRALIRTVTHGTYPT